MSTNLADLRAEIWHELSPTSQAECWEYCVDAAMRYLQRGFSPAKCEEWLWQTWDMMRGH